MDANSAPLSTPAPDSVAAPLATTYLPASIGQRIGNAVIDSIAEFIWSIAYGIVFGAIVAANSSSFNPLNFVMGLLPFPLYFLFFEGIWQRTPGKWITGTKVVMRDGSKPDFMHILGRSFLRLIPFEALSFITNSNPTGWHDRWSGTMVVPASYGITEIQAIDLSRRKKTPRWVLVAVLVPFTLAIGGILAAVVLASLTPTPAYLQAPHQAPSGQAGIKGRDAVKVAEVKVLSIALELYNSENGTYPQSLDQLVPNYVSITTSCDNTERMACLTNPLSTYHYYRCSNLSYHIATSLADNTSEDLGGDADAAALCPGDPIDGHDTGPCQPSEQGSACYDFVQTDTNTPSATSQTPSGQTGINGSRNQGNMGQPDNGSGQVQQPIQD